MAPLVGSKCVLVEEDDGELRDLLAEALRDEGYVVVTASKGGPSRAKPDSGSPSKRSRYPGQALRSGRCAGIGGVSDQTHILLSLISW